MSPEKIEGGTFINYKLKLHGLPIRWMTLIKEWEPGSHFVDYQLKGPYNIWHHRHSFTQLKNGVLMEDKVHYEIPFSFLTDFFIGWWIKKDVAKIFQYRKEILKKLIGEPIVHQSLIHEENDLALHKNIDSQDKVDDSNPIH